MTRITVADDGRTATDKEGFEYVKGNFRWIKVGHKDDPPCTGSGYSHPPHGNCPGYTYDRT